MAPLRSLSEILQSSTLIDGDNPINESFKLTYDLLKTYFTSSNQLVDTLTLTNPNTGSNYTEEEIRASLQIYSQGDYANLDTVDIEAATNPPSLNKVSLPYIDPQNYTLYIDLSANTWSLIYDKTNVNHAILSGSITNNDTFLEGSPLLEDAMIEFPVSQFGATGVKTLDATTGDGITGFNTIIRPSMRITASEVASGATSNDATLSLTFTSSQPTTDFAETDISVTNGSLSNFASTGDNLVYTATFTPSGDGECTISVAENTFNDAAGNGNTASAQFTWLFDNTRPSMTISATEVNSGATSNDATLSLTFTSSEATTDFAETDISVTNGSLSAFTPSGDGLVYTATFTPTTNGNCTISVAENTFNDAAGNGNTASAQFTWIFDNTEPDYDITQPIGNFIFNIDVPIANRSNDKRPTLVINTNEAGTLTTNIETGFENGSSLSVSVGTNTIQLAELQYGTYSGKTLTLTDSANNSETVTIPTFNVVAPSLIIRSGVRNKRDIRN